MRPLSIALAYLVVVLAFVACGEKRTDPHEVAAEPQAPEAGDDPAEPVIDEIVGQDPREQHIFRGERDAPAVFVRVREGGILEWKYREEWREKTLEDLGTILGNARDKYDLQQRQTGKSVFEPLPRDPNAGIFLSIEADPGVPWQHIRWIMTVAAEQKIRKLELSEGARTLLAMLPTDEVDEGAEGNKPPRAVEVHAVVRAERPATSGDADASRPIEVRYRCGDTETADLADVIAYLKNAKAEHGKKGQAALVGEIEAGHKVPYARVFDVMDAFVAADLTSVGFYEPAIPPKSVRSAKRLP